MIMNNLILHYNFIYYDFFRTSPWTHHSSTMCVTVMVSEKCQSLGDVLRDIDSKAVVKSDFALLSAFTVSNLNIISILNNHR